MQKIISRSLLILIFTMTLSTALCSAQNFKFVDAEDTTGYYVDMDNVKIEGKEFISTTLAVVKANLNKMYVYDVRINLNEQKYQIISSKIFEYDTRTLMETNERSRPYRPYAPKSEMAELINFILYGDEPQEN